MFLSSGSKPSGGSGGGDWLGLGGDDDDGSLDLNNVPLKTSTPFPRESKKDLPSTQGAYTFFLSLLQVACITLLFPLIFNNLVTLCHFPAAPERQERQASPPRRAGRRRGDSDNDEFLRMLGITPEEPPKPNQVESAGDSGK